MRADLAVLSDDSLQVPTETIHDERVVGTMLARVLGCARGVDSVEGTMRMELHLPAMPSFVPAVRLAVQCPHAGALGGNGRRCLPPGL